MTLPALGLVVLFFVVPIGLMIWMSLNNWPLLGHKHFIGLSNYFQMFQDRVFGHSLLVTLEYVVIMTPVQLIVGVGLALLVRRPRAGVRVLRTFYFVPVVVGFAAGAYIFYVMLQPGTGIVDAILSSVGIAGPSTQWLTQPGRALGSVVALSTWKTVGTSMILFMAGMQAISADLYDAAEIDGAGWLRREFQITLPLLKRTFALVLIITVVWAFLAFDQFFVLTQGGPHQATLTAVMWIYTVAFVQYRLGYSSTLSVAVLLMLIVVSVLQLRVLRGEPDE